MMGKIGLGGYSTYPVSCLVVVGFSRDLEFFAAVGGVVFYMRVAAVWSVSRAVRV